MTQPQTIDYTYLILPVFGIRQCCDDNTQKDSGLSDHKPFIRKADRPKTTAQLLGPENLGLLRLIHFWPATITKEWISGCLEDEYDRPGSDIPMLSRSPAIQRQCKEEKKDKRRRRELKKFLKEEKKSRRVVYSDHMTSDKWRFFRDQVISERGGMCERCGKRGHAPMNVHHLTYARLGQELPDDVKVYCLPCHKLMHPGWE